MIIYEEILRAFQKAKVKYILVGGIALNLHGALRATADLDILVEMSDENLAKIVSILRNRGYQVRQPVDPMGIADAEIRKDWIRNKHMKAFNFFKGRELEEVDIIIDSPVSYAAASKQTKKIKIDGILLPLISIEHLIQMKRGTGREIDRLDVAQLKKIKKLRRSK